MLYRYLHALEVPVAPKHKENITRFSVQSCLVVLLILIHFQRVTHFTLLAISEPATDMPSGRQHRLRGG